jgi:hypothetical protein
MGLRILVACEESQIVTSRARALGHEAYSCDILPTSGENPEWHLQQDVIPLLSEKWDMILAFPPCTHLASSGAAWFAEKRADGRQQEGIDFFMKFTQVDCPLVAIENPIGIMSTNYRKPDQIIQPYMFGHTERKATCLWLKGLPKLSETNNVFDDMMLLPKNRRERLHYLPPSPDRARIRSKTFTGIADAMVSQWMKEAP